MSNILLNNGKARVENVDYNSIESKERYRLLIEEILSFSKEDWKDVAGFEVLYQVSNIGRVKNFITSKILKPSFCFGGYPQVMISKGCRKFKTFKIHRLVGLAFIDNPENKPFINHKNGDVKDNRVENLEWCSAHENTKHSYDVLNRIPYHGETHDKAKLTNDDVREIRNKYIPYKYSTAKLGKEYGVRPKYYTFNNNR